MTSITGVSSTSTIWRDCAPKWSRCSSTCITGLLRLVRDGVLDGLRIDHIDGMFDPKAYLRRLQRRLTARRAGRHFYLVVEKILTPHERLRADWPVDGTTGYDFLNQVLGVLIDGSAAGALTDCYVEFTGERRSFAEIARLCKLHIMITRWPASSMCWRATRRGWRARIRAPRISRATCCAGPSRS